MLFHYSGVKAVGHKGNENATSPLLNGNVCESSTVTASERIAG